METVNSSMRIYINEIENRMMLKMKMVKMFLISKLLK